MLILWMFGFRIDIGYLTDWDFFNKQMCGKVDGVDVYNKWKSVSEVELDMVVPISKP